MSERAFPVPDAVTQAFWDAIAEDRLLVQRCRACGKHVFYPRAVCPHCTTGELGWVEAAGSGRVHSFTVVHRAPDLTYKDEVPYVVALVDLDEGVRMMSRVVGCRTDEVHCEMAVKVSFEGDPKLPVWRKSE